MSKRDPVWELKEETDNKAVRVHACISDCITHIVIETVDEDEAANLRPKAKPGYGKFVDIISSAESDCGGDLVLWGLTKALQRTQGLSLHPGIETCKCEAIQRIFPEL